jgi:hypothetical protein
MPLPRASEDGVVGPLVVGAGLELSCLVLQ